MLQDSLWVLKLIAPLELCGQSFSVTTQVSRVYKAFLACSSQAMQEGVPRLPIIDQGVRTHACHPALTWPASLHGLGLIVVTWQFKATTWHERAKSLLVWSPCASPWACPCMHDLCGCILLLSVALGTSAWLPGAPA